MKLGVDVYYYNDKAKVVGGLFNEWTDDSPCEIISTCFYGFSKYETGNFYKRELPCLCELLRQIDKSKLETIIIDGYVYLNNEGKAGLGYYLYEQLGMQIPIIGVAKRPFYNNNKFVVEIYRGKSMIPLYITSIGINLQEASSNIRNMAGKYRIPNILKVIDQQTRMMR